MLWNLAVVFCIRPDYLTREFTKSRLKSHCSEWLSSSNDWIHMMNDLSFNNGKGHLTSTAQKSWEKNALYKRVSRRLLKTCSEEAEVTCCDRLFQRRGPATMRNQSPRKERQVRRTTSCDNDTERRRFRLCTSAGWHSSSAREVAQTRVDICTREQLQSRCSRVHTSNK